MPNLSIRLPVLALMLFFPILLKCQEYGYTHYNYKDGLAGSTVYAMTQDMYGFMWFATETGLSRFDGTHFKNFTQQDGLPDNDILQIFADSKGRVWIAPFKKSICYYFKGRIYNQQNDTALQKLRVTNYIVRFAEDVHGNILMQEVQRLHMMHADGQATTFEKIGQSTLHDVVTIGRSPSGNFWLMKEDSVFEWANGRLAFLRTEQMHSHHYKSAVLTDRLMLWRQGYDGLRIYSPLTGKTFFSTYYKDCHNMVCIDSTTYALCSDDGLFIKKMGSQDTLQRFLEGMPVSNLLIDTEGNMWFSTLGSGVYRLNSEYVKNLQIRNKQKYSQQVYSFAGYGKDILVGIDKGIYRLSFSNSGQLEAYNTGIKNSGAGNVSAIFVDKNNKIFFGSNLVLYKANLDVNVNGKVANVKAIIPYHDNLLVATGDSVMIVGKDVRKNIEKVWSERSTTVFADVDTIYIGGLNGLYCRRPDKTIQYLGDRHRALKNRITAMAQDASGIIWISTYGAGVVAYRNGQIITCINQQHGLTSNFCRAVFMHKNALWVGTDKGLNKIATNKPGYPITKYTVADGLASDIINALYARGSTVFVGTSEGIAYFDEQKIQSRSRCDLLFTEITIGGKAMHPDFAPASIPHDNNNIRFDYAGISYKSVGDIRYKYRLLGLDSSWKETRETFLSYPTLPSGDYELQLQAFNKFDVPSMILTARFTIEELLWERSWFRILAGAVFLALIALMIWVMVSRVRSREQEKTAISQRIGDLEQLARKSQMNPHFIFNSLNSIQQYVMDADLAGANKFISGFSRLIRQTLDFSSKKEISLEEEINYLTNYLELEKTRLEAAFTYSVNIGEDIRVSEQYVPPMILQPFVENSVRHGLRYRKDKDGIISITVIKQNNQLIFVLEDNGVGRKAAQQYKSISPIEYQSKGISLTAERIALLNKDNPDKIRIKIEDLEDGLQNALGTRVTISLPVS